MQYSLLNDTKLCYTKLWELINDDDVFADTPSVFNEWIYSKLQAAIDDAMHYGISSPLYEAILAPVRHLVDSGTALVEPTLSLHLPYHLSVGDNIICFPYIQYNITLIIT